MNLKIYFIGIFSFFLLLNNVYYTNASFAKCSTNDPGKILETRTGKIKGTCQHVLTHTDTHEIGENVYSWFSIPFAEKQTKENRFESPKPVRPWTDVLDGSKWPNSCYQTVDKSLSDLKLEEQFSGYKMWIPSRKHSNFSEDCLYLNVFIPASVYLKQSLPSSKNEPTPIVVFIHGSSSTPVLDIFDPSNFVAISGLIAVSITYRTGIFGSLYLDGETEGNQGFLDQHLALKWIHNNADTFGGDPNRITLLGSSAGAALIGYHLLYKPSWPLFNNVILQAGSPFVNYAKPISKREATSRARGFLTAIGCGSETSSNGDLLACARNHTDEYLAKNVKVYFVDHLLGGRSAASNLQSVFPLVIDKEIIKEDPEEAFKDSDNFKSCPILSGYSANEGSMFLAYAGLMGAKSSELRKQVPVSFKNLVNFINDYLKYYPVYPHESKKVLRDAILFHYTKLTSDFSDASSPLNKINYFGALSRIIGDQHFVCPSLKLLDIYAKRNQSVYSYFYAHRITSSPWPSWYGIVHGDELAMVMGQPLAVRPQNTAISTNPWLSPKAGYPRWEKQLSKEMILYWSNFAKFNNPNIQDKEAGNDEELKDWPLFKVNGQSVVDNQQYLILKTNGTKTARSLAFEECQFWNHFIPALIKDTSK
jgi:acetylcholinesterase